MQARFADLLARVVRYWHHTLVNSAAAREALRRLGVGVDTGQVYGLGKRDAGHGTPQPPASTNQPPDPLPSPFPASLVERFVIGFVDGTLHQIVPAKGEIVEQLRVLGILDTDGRERFVGSVVIPVFDDQENVIQAAFYTAAGGGDDAILMGSRCPGGDGAPPLRKPPAADWLFDETPTWWNAAVLKHAREVAIAHDPLAGLAAIGLGARALALSYGEGSRPPSNPRESDPAGAAKMAAVPGDTAVIAPAGPGVPLGQGAKDLLVLHAPRLTILCDDAAWSAALTREIEPLGIAIKTMREVTGETPAPHDAAVARASCPLPRATTGSVAVNDKFRSSAVVSVDRDGITVDFPRRLRFIVQGIVQDSPRHLRASVKALRCGSALRGATGGSAEGRAQKGPPTREDPPTRIHLDTLDLYHARSRIGFAKTAACLLGEDPAVMEEHMAEVVRLAEEFLKKPDAPAASVVLTDSEKDEALAFLRNPRLLDRVLADLAALGYVGEETNKLVAYVASVSRKLEDALSVLVVSRSGAGKSTLAEAVGMLAPEEDVLRLTRLTPQTLYYQKKDALAHKLVLIEEAEGVEEAAYALRVLQSARYLSLSTAAGRGESQTREVRGPVSLFMTTTRTDVDEETASRFLILTADESAGQTRRILEAQRAAEAKPPAEKDHILRIHRNAQRLLAPLAIVNPYAPQLTFPHDRLSARRDHKRYLALIRAMAFLHQRQRTIQDSAVAVDVRDIEIANRLANEALGQSIYDLTPPSRRLLIAIREWLVERAVKEGGQPADIRFTRRWLREYTTWRRTQLEEHLKELVQAEYVLPVTGGGQGRRTEYRLDWDGKGMDGEKFYRGLVDTGTLSGGSAIRTPMGDLPRSPGHRSPPSAIGECPPAGSAGLRAGVEPRPSEGKLAGCLSAACREAPDKSKPGPNGPEKPKKRGIRKTCRVVGGK